MQQPSTSARARRLLAVSAAAIAVMIAPTACEYGAFNGGSSSHDLGDTPGANQGTQSPVVVPVANTSSNNSRHGWNHGGSSTSTTTTSAAATTTTTTAAPTTDPTTTVATDPAATDTLTTDPTTAPPASGANTVGVGGKDGNNNGLVVLGRDCATGTNAGLPVHDGFQDPGATCVQTEMGAVAAKTELPSLLITEAPRVVGMNQAFTLKVSTRNLVRDRFLGAKAGGYYLESSFLNADGLQRGHFHTACRILPQTDVAPDSSVDPQFFLATEDGGGGRDADVVTIPVPAIGKTGILQCSSWAGDGSHRTPMMTQANETPAFDSVRIFVTNRDQPVRFDGRGRADSARTDRAHAQQSGAQKPDPNPSAPAAPNAAAAPATATDNAGNPLPADAAPAAVDDGAPADAAAPADTAAPAGN